MRVVLIFFLMILFRNGLYAQSVFFETYPDAEKNVADTYNRMDELRKLEKDKGKILFSIVAPEVAMYRSILDLFETTTAEIFYVNLGKDYGNFSLGSFQMKPSFAEEIERDYNKECKSGKYLKLISYAGIDDESEIRVQRIERLKSEYWQQIYLICFYDIMEQRHEAKRMNISEKVAFYASAYNYGYNSSVSKIEDWMDHISFPGRMGESIVSYSDVAADFLKILCPDLNIESVDEKMDHQEIESDSVICKNETIVVGGVSESMNPPSLKPAGNKYISIKFVGFSFLGAGILFAVVFVRLRKRGC